MIRGISFAMVVLVACDRSPSNAPAANGSPVARPSIAMLEVSAATGAASPNLVASDHRALLTWLEPSEGNPGQRRLRISELVAGHWTTPRTIVEGPAIVSNWADVPSVVRQDARTLIAHWAEQSSAGAEAYDAIVARSIDDGGTWQRLGLVHRDHTATEHGFVSLIPDGDAVLAVWLDGRATARPGGATSLRGARIGETILLAWTDVASQRPRVARIALADVPSVTGSASRVNAVVSRVPVGSRADDYAATLLDNVSVDLHSLRGSPVLLNVWATWCEPCRAELPLLSCLQARLAPRGLRTIALSVDRDGSIRRTAHRRRSVWARCRPRCCSTPPASSCGATRVRSRTTSLRSPPRSTKC